MDHRPFGLQNRAWSVEQVGEDVRFPLDMDRREGNPFAWHIPEVPPREWKGRRRLSALVIYVGNHRELSDHALMWPDGRHSDRDLRALNTAISSRELMWGLVSPSPRPHSRGVLTSGRPSPGGWRP